MDDLITWLRQQINEDERGAQAAFSGQADPENGWVESRTTGYAGVGIAPHVGHIHEDAQAAHVVRWNPARVLREVEAKRAILGDIQMCQACGIGRRCVPHDASCGEPTTRPRHPDDEQLIRLLASPFSDRPGYRESWRP